MGKDFSKRTKVGLSDQKAGGFATPVELLMHNNPTDSMTRVILVLQR